MVELSNFEKHVDFHAYCKKCEHKSEDETDPNSACYDCLFTPVNAYSRKPLYFKEASK